MWLGIKKKTEMFLSLNIMEKYIYWGYVSRDLLPSSGNLNNHIVHIYRKYADLDGNNGTCESRSCVMRLIINQIDM